MVSVRSESLAALLFLIVLAGCTAPQAPATGENSAKDPSSTSSTPILVLGVLAFIQNASASGSSGDATHASAVCDMIFGTNANLTEGRLAYPSGLGIGRINGSLSYVQLMEAHGPDASDSSCADPYSLTVNVLGAGSVHVQLARFVSDIPLVTRSPATAMVNGTNVAPGHYWSSSVNSTINGTVFTGSISIINFGAWSNVTEYECPSHACTPPFSEPPDLAAYVDSHPSARTG